MNLMLVRHAIALEPEEMADPRAGDAARPLSPRGIERMELQVQGLRRIMSRLDCILHSPYLRTAQTAAIIRAGFGGCRCEVLEALAPGGREADVLKRLEHLPQGCCAVLVGHEPDMSIYLSRFTAGDGSVFVKMKKGAAALIEFGVRPQWGRGQLLWYLPPRALRQLGGAQDDGQE